MPLPESSPLRLRFVPLAIALALLVGILLMSDGGDDRITIEVTQAWLLEQPMGQPSSGGFTLRNGTRAPLILQEVDAEDFGHVGISRIDDGEVADFEPLTLQSGDTLTLGQTDKILVFSQPKKQLRSGDDSLLTLRFNDARIQWTNAKVRKQAPTS